MPEIELTAEERALSEALTGLMSDEIDSAGGRLPFHRFMELALYAPGLGYYVNGRYRFGAAGDFVTAPELSPAFGYAVAQQLSNWMTALDEAVVMELGAGTGRLAVDVLTALEGTAAMPREYWILELSPDLRRLQRETLTRELPHLVSRVVWLDRLPEAGFKGVVLGNEVVDAMPVSRIRWSDSAWQEGFVVATDDGLIMQWADPETPRLTEALQRRFPEPPAFADGYESEINVDLAPWVAAITENLARGALLLIDYGYSAREYYHPERASGTLICHFRHRALEDPLALPGLQDITANVDFSALAQAGVAAGLELSAYTTQAHFMLANGLDDWMAKTVGDDGMPDLGQLQAVKQLTLPAEMGERFKAIAFTCGISSPSNPPIRDLRDRL